MPLAGTNPVVVPPERCLLCGGRHHSQLRPDGQRVLTVAQAAVHLNATEEDVYKALKSGCLVKAPNRGPRQTGILERNVLNYLEGRAQERHHPRLAAP